VETRRLLDTAAFTALYALIPMVLLTPPYVSGTYMLLSVNAILYAHIYVRHRLLRAAAGVVYIEATVVWAQQRYALDLPVAAVHEVRPDLDLEGLTGDALFRAIQKKLTEEDVLGKAEEPEA